MIFIHTVSIVMALAVPLMYCVNMLQVHIHVQFKTVSSLNPKV